MEIMTMWDKYDKKYRDVIDIKELAKYIQDLIIKIKNEKASDNFITISQGKLDTIITLGKILNDLEVEDD